MTPHQHIGTARCNYVAHDNMHESTHDHVRLVGSLLKANTTGPIILTQEKNGKNTVFLWHRKFKAVVYRLLFIFTALGRLRDNLHNYDLGGVSLGSG